MIIFSDLPFQWYLLLIQFFGYLKKCGIFDHLCPFSPHSSHFSAFVQKSWDFLPLLIRPSFYVYITSLAQSKVLEIRFPRPHRHSFAVPYSTLEHLIYSLRLWNLHRAHSLNCVSPKKRLALRNFTFV